MGYHKRPPHRKKPVQVDAIIAKADAQRSAVPQPSKPQSYAGWNWEDGSDPYLQTGQQSP